MEYVLARFDNLSPTTQHVANERVSRLDVGELDLGLLRPFTSRLRRTRSMRNYFAEY